MRRTLRAALAAALQAACIARADYAVSTNLPPVEIATRADVAASNAVAVATATNLAAQAAALAHLPMVFPATGTVARSGSSILLTQTNGMATAQLSDGTATVARITADWTRLVVIESPEDADPNPANPAFPSVGTVFVQTNRWDAFFPDLTPYYESEDGSFALAAHNIDDPFWRWAVAAAQPGWDEGVFSWWYGHVRVPGEDPAHVATGIDDLRFVVSPAKHTNTVALASVQDTASKVSVTNGVASGLTVLDGVRWTVPDLGTVETRMSSNLVLEIWSVE